mmetsp:Transcript_46131/g.103943  ORF Transcript_46131/g.103943 Transcript_46131/m.103943 type:complete len:232 (+) Transcript_46131:677-1372(+)
MTLVGSFEAASAEAASTGAVQVSLASTASAEVGSSAGSARSARSAVVAATTVTGALPNMASARATSSTAPTLCAAGVVFARRRAFFATFSRAVFAARRRAALVCSELAAADADAVECVRYLAWTCSWQLGGVGGSCCCVASHAAGPIVGLIQLVVRGDQRIASGFAMTLTHGTDLSSSIANGSRHPSRSRCNSHAFATSWLGTGASTHGGLGSKAVLLLVGALTQVRGLRL